MQTTRDMIDDLGRNPDDGSTLMNGDDLLQGGTFAAADRKGPTITFEDGTPWGDPVT